MVTETVGLRWVTLTPSRRHLIEHRIVTRYRFTTSRRPLCRGRHTYLRAKDTPQKEVPRHWFRVRVCPIFRGPPEEECVESGTLPVSGHTLN